MALAEPIRLTSLSHGAGCACKLGPSQLAEVLDLLGPSLPAEDVVVSEGSGDDAAVYRLPDGRGLVVTIDFFTPLVDDAYEWGRIAAANALSDVYAMGGTPIARPERRRLASGRAAVGAARRRLARGTRRGPGSGRARDRRAHDHRPAEPLYGMVAVGIADLDRLLRNTEARPGTGLVLTKPIGVGMITTAVKRGVATAAQLDTAVSTMTTLNAAASRSGGRRGCPCAATDVTGFGLLGHLHNMLQASGCAATIDAAAVPLFPAVLELAQRGVVAGGTQRNHAFLEPTTDWGATTLPEQLLLADAQTSGGLLLASHDSDALVDALRAGGVDAWRIGAVVDGPPGRVDVSTAAAD